MGHKAFALTSCVAALPAAILCYVLVVDGFLRHADKMNVKTLIMTAFTLALSLFIVLIPGGILVYGRPRKPKGAAETPSKIAPAVPAAEEGSASEASVAEFESSEDEMAATLDSSDDVSVFDSSEDAVLDSDAEIVADDDLELDATTAFSTPAKGSDLELGDSDTFGDDEMSEIEEIEDEVIFEDDEDEEPPSRKKKR